MKEVQTSKMSTSQTEGSVTYRVRDFVKVIFDENGEISKGIQKPGIGEIIRISETDIPNGSNRYYLIRMMDGASSYLSSKNLEKIETIIGGHSNHKILSNGTQYFAVSEGSNFYQIGDLVTLIKFPTKALAKTHTAYSTVGEIIKVTPSEKASDYYTIKLRDGQILKLSSDSFSLAIKKQGAVPSHTVYSNFYGDTVAIKEKETLYALGDTIRVLSNTSSKKTGKIIGITCNRKYSVSYYLVLMEGGQLQQLSSNVFAHSV